MNKKRSILVSLLLISILMITGCSQGKTEEIFPSRDINGIIQWGAGGGTDIISRSLTPHVEAQLGKTIVLQNMTGATGAIAAQYVYGQPADGYTLLYGAENPQLYEVMEISELSYDDFEPIIVIGRETAVVVTTESSGIDSLDQLLDNASDSPGTIKLGTTGPGGLPYVVAALFNAVDKAEFNQIPFDGDGPVVTALLGGHVDVTVTKLSAVKELASAGEVKILGSISEEPITGYEEIPAITSTRPEYSKYLPWGPFYGVYAKKDTSPEIIEILKNAYLKGFQNGEFQEFLSESAITPMGISGDEARDFLENWKKVSSWLLYDAGGAKISPEELGIERVNP